MKLNKNHKRFLKELMGIYIKHNITAIEFNELIKRFGRQIVSKEDFVEDLDGKSFWGNLFKRVKKK